MKKILIVGAGVYGSVCAHELTKMGYMCHVIDKRNHIAGNCYTKYDDESECHEHVYGAHIFHTDSKRIWDYVNQFAEFNHFVNRVKVSNSGNLYSFPFNLFTLYQVFGVRTPAEARRVLDSERICIDKPSNMEEQCLSIIGPRLYKIFVEGYTKKQWKMHPRELPASIIKRIPVRFNFDDNYFNDRYQGIPVGGYTALFEKMLEGVSVDLGIDFNEDQDYWLSKYDSIIYTGSMDGFFGYSQGCLDYRSLRFERELLDVNDYQGNAVINYTEESVPYTRIIEHKHFDMSFSAASTLITREYPDDWDINKEAYYPISTESSQKRYSVYTKMAQELSGKVFFGGRLAEYRYYDMHQVFGSALQFIKNGGVKS